VSEAYAYGVAVPAESALRAPVNRARPALRENGRHERLREKWFGSE
jgi:ABC-type amino acid transport substrate-binding protein